MGGVFSDLAGGGAQSANAARRRAHKHLYLVFGGPTIRFTGSGRAPLIYHVIVPTAETAAVEEVGGVRCSAAVSSRAGVAPVLLPTDSCTSPDATTTAPVDSQRPVPPPTLESAMAAVSAVAAAAVDTLTGGSALDAASPSQQRMRRVLRRDGGGAGARPAAHRSGSTPTDDDGEGSDDPATAPRVASDACSGGAAARRMRFVVDLDDVETQSSGPVRVDVFVRARIRYVAGSGVAIEPHDTPMRAGGRNASAGWQNQKWGQGQEEPPYHVLSTALREGRCSTAVETEAFCPADLVLSSTGIGADAGTDVKTPTKPSTSGAAIDASRRQQGGASAGAAAPTGSAAAAARVPKRPVVPSGFTLIEDGPARGLPSHAHIVVRIMYNSVAADSAASAPATTASATASATAGASGGGQRTQAATGRRSPLAAAEPATPSDVEGAGGMPLATAEPPSEAPSVLAMTIGSQAVAARSTSVGSNLGVPGGAAVGSTRPSDGSGVAAATAASGGGCGTSSTPTLHQLFYFYELPPSAATAPDAAPLTLRAHPVRLLQVGTSELYRLESIFDLGGDAGVHAPSTAAPSALASPNGDAAAHAAVSDGEGDRHSDHDGGDGGKPLSGSPSAALEAARVEEDDSDDCVVCLSAPKDTLILPCRHLCLCADCAPLLRQQSNKCPVCRGAIERIVCIR